LERNRTDRISEEALRKPGISNDLSEVAEDDDTKPAEPVRPMDIPPTGLEDFG
jgi:hypothetical protein